MRHTKEVSIRTVYIFLLFIFYQHFFKMTAEPTMITFYSVFFLMGMAHYLLDLFNFNLVKYRIHDFILSLCVIIVLGSVFFIIDHNRNFLLFFMKFFLVQNLLRWIFIKLTSEKHRIAIIGDNSKNGEVINYLKKNERYRYKGYFSSFSEKKGKYLGKLEDIKEIVKKHSINKLVLTESNLKESVLTDLIDLKLKGVKVISYLVFNEEVQGKIDVKEISEKWILNERGFNMLHNRVQNRLKRVFDLFLSLVLFIVASPVILISAIIIKIESPGPIFFRQTRIGFRNQPFEMIKFRSMKLHDPNEHSKYAGEKDDRITKYGNFMRKTRIDELPQLWNVIKGDMSFVGPRAEWDELCYNYMDKIPHYNLRHSIQPGLTGWAQVMYPYGAGVEDAMRKLEYDLYYIKHQNFVMDVFVFFKTVKTVLFGKGR